jgi:hypothetical protein
MMIVSVVLLAPFINCVADKPLWRVRCAQARGRHAKPCFEPAAELKIVKDRIEISIDKLGFMARGAMPASGICI